MTILDTIVEHKRVEVQMRKQKYTLSDLQSLDLVDSMRISDLGSSSSYHS